MGKKPLRGLGIGLAVGAGQVRIMGGDGRSGTVQGAERILRIAQTSRGEATALVDAVLAEALRVRASDIHIDPVGTGTRIAMRVDGGLYDVVEIPSEVTPYLLGRLKVISGLLSHRTDVPQEGRLSREDEGRKVDLRVSTFPTVLGERAVVRIFDPIARGLELDGLGFGEGVVAAIRGALEAREGLALLTGPAGSGKTTTAYACLSTLARGRERRSIVSVEDPVERLIEGVVQVEVRPKAGLTFAKCLAHILRQDPEVIVVGEARDAETAAIAVQASLTGHLVISTLHCPSAAGAFVRLLDMGIEPYLLASGVSMVVNQRLVRRLCAGCREREEGRWLARGCAACGGAGYAGRTGVAEIVRMDDAIRGAVLARADRTVFEQAGARQMGDQTIEGAMRELYEEGVTSAAEGERVLGVGR
ncbi:MAG: GspE/PulE family protein [Planctomycetota bacterium]